MPSRQPFAVFETHKVINQPPHFPEHNLFDADIILRKAVEREGAGWAQAKIQSFGAITGSEEVAELARAANRYPPELRIFDRFGQRIDQVDYHPAYHELMSLAKKHEVHSIAWSTSQPGGHVAHMALEYLLVQADAGVCCPITMTYASIPPLSRDPAVAAEWIPRILTPAYDSRFAPVHEKTGITLGMAMTEKQGGSDVRANMTTATRLSDKGEFELSGHKWFCSAPMSDAFLTLAQTKSGVSCFLVPRWRPDGSRNPFYIQRLKDKLGDRSNASSEIEYKNTWAQLLGEEGQGIRVIIDMVHHTRLDTAIAAAGIMRQAVVQAIHHAQHRKAFGKFLCQQPLMQNVLADLVIEWVAATMLAARVARSFDEAAFDSRAASFSRIGVAIAKYWTNKRVPGHVCEALECHGGSGYVEESIMPRLYRQAPLNSIWEGSANVICIDVLRTMVREPSAVETLIEEIELSRGGNRRLDLAIDKMKARINDSARQEIEARRLVEFISIVLQGALLVKHAPSAIGDAFCASRFEDDQFRNYGTLPQHVAFDEIIRLGSVS